MKSTMKRLSISLAVAMGLVAITSLADPIVKIGAVAQRYPWNGTIDVRYKASGLPAAGTNATVSVAANGEVYTQDVKISNGTNAVAVTSLPKNVKAKDAKVTLKLN